MQTRILTKDLDEKEITGLKKFGNNYGMQSLKEFLQKVIVLLQVDFLNTVYRSYLGQILKTMNRQRNAKNNWCACFLILLNFK